MFTRCRRIPTLLLFSIIVAACFGLWHILPNSLRRQIEPTAHAATFTVNTADDHNDGVCNAADCALREAINAVNIGAGGDRPPALWFWRKSFEEIANRSLQHLAAFLVRQPDGGDAGRTTGKDELALAAVAVQGVGFVLVIRDQQG